MSDVYPISIMRSIFLFLSLSIFFLSPFHAQTTWYVHAGSTSGQPDGSSWQNAFATLQDALQAALYGDEIWVATGVYTPTQTTQRNRSFVLKTGVKLLGGFGGTESSAADRNPAINLTRLSGNIGDPADSTDNSYHVLTGKGLDDNTILDGFIISDGYSIGTSDTDSDQFGAGLFLLGDTGLTDSRPLIVQCVFEHNQAGQGGGGLFAGHINPSDPFGPQHLVNPRIRNCTFLQNRANFSGGGMMKSGPTSPSDTFLLDSCRFTDNYSFVSHGAGMQIEKTGNSMLTIRNCIFEYNESQGGDGGGLNVTANSEGAFTIGLNLESCTFYKNRAPAGGGFYIDGIYHEPIDYTINLLVNTCLFEENDARSDNGGAFMVYIGENGLVDAKILNSRVIKNIGLSFFATSFICNENSEAKILVEKCEFTGNTDSDNPNSNFFAFSAGGNKVHSRLNNCLFSNNSGGAIFAGGHEETRVLTEVTNCTFFHNGANPFGKRWYSSFNQTGAQYYNKMNFYNCAIWEPQSNHRLIYNNNPDILNGSWFFFDYCSLSPLIPSPAVIPNKEDVFGDSIYHSVYPGFLDTLAGDFRLGSCAPIMNRGSNEAVNSAGLVVDFDGQPRIRFGRVDLGAYERQDSCFTSTINEPETLFSGMLWPNPAASGSRVQWEFPEAELKEVRWQLKDNFGRLLSAGNETASGITAPDTPGIYWVVVQVGERVQQFKLVVQR